MSPERPALDLLRLALAGPAKAEVLRLARDSAHAALTGEDAAVPVANRLPDLEIFGAFVSLHLGERLCGCMGLVGVDAPLARVVAEAARSAATRDPRFELLSTRELELARVEVSLMTPLESLETSALPDAVRVGRDGLVVSEGARRGLLLPQVALEHGMDARAFLEATCRKAGLPRDAWCRAARVERFSALVLSD